jgi:uncharacterized iron-regulated membrane protein
VTFLQRPHNNLVRKALLKVHLWTGLTVALYVVLIGSTGAALVFRPEMQKVTFPEFSEIARHGEPDVDSSTIIRELQTQFPGYRLLGIDYPTYRRGTYLSYLIKGAELRTVFSHPVSGKIIGELPKTSWITRLQDLHFDLLGGSTGRTINGVGAFVLIVMFSTGLVIWWPGIERWRQAMVVNFRKGWKRTNWDLHSATGFWLLALLMLWAVTGVEFAFRRPFQRAVNAVSPLTVFRAPESKPRTGAAPPAADTSVLIAKSIALVPGAKMGRVVLPSNARGVVLILMAYKTHGDFDTSDEVHLYFDQYSGELLQRRVLGAETHSAGDLFMTWIGPLHVGSFGGTGATGTIVKILWSILALSFPTLAVTGLLVWWNGSGRRLFKRVRPEAPQTGAA